MKDRLVVTLSALLLAILALTATFLLSCVQQNKDDPTKKWESTEQNEMTPDPFVYTPLAENTKRIKYSTDILRKAYSLDEEFGKSDERIVPINTIQLSFDVPEEWDVVTDTPYVTTYGQTNAQWKLSINGIFDKNYYPDERMKVEKARTEKGFNYNIYSVSEQYNTYVFELPNNHFFDFSLNKSDMDEELCQKIVDSVMLLNSTAGNNKAPKEPSEKMQTISFSLNRLRQEINLNSPSNNTVNGIPVIIKTHNFTLEIPEAWNESSQGIVSSYGIINPSTGLFNWRLSVEGIHDYNMYEKNIPKIFNAKTKNGYTYSTYRFNPNALTYVVNLPSNYYFIFSLPYDYFDENTIHHIVDSLTIDIDNESDTSQPTTDPIKTRPIVHNESGYHTFDIAAPVQKFDGFTYVFEIPEEWKAADDRESNEAYALWNNETKESDTVLLFRSLYKVEKDFVLDETIQEKASAWYMINHTEDNYPKGEKKVTSKGYEYVLYPSFGNVYIRLSEEFILQFSYSTYLVSETVSEGIINSFDALGAYKTKSYNFTVTSARLDNTDATVPIDNKKVYINIPEEYFPNENLVFGQAPQSFVIFATLITDQHYVHYNINHIEQSSVLTTNGYKYDMYTNANGQKCYTITLPDNQYLTLCFNQISEAMQKAIINSISLHHTVIHKTNELDISFKIPSVWSFFEDQNFSAAYDAYDNSFNYFNWRIKVDGIYDRNVYSDLTPELESTQNSDKYSFAAYSVSDGITKCVVKLSEDKFFVFSVNRQCVKSHTITDIANSIIVKEAANIIQKNPQNTDGIEMMQIKFEPTAAKKTIAPPSVNGTSFVFVEAPSVTILMDIPLEMKFCTYDYLIDITSYTRINHFSSFSISVHKTVSEHAWTNTTVQGYNYSLSTEHETTTIATIKLSDDYNLELYYNSDQPNEKLFAAVLNSIEIITE